MELSSIEELLRADPYRPFRLNFNNGSQVDVHNPALVVPMKRQLFIADADREGFHLYSMLHVVAAHSLDNGSRRLDR